MGKKWDMIERKFERGDDSIRATNDGILSPVVVVVVVVSQLLAVRGVI